MGSEHAMVLANSPAASLHVCCDINPDAQVRVPEGTAFTASLKAALRWPGVEAVFVCTPESLHRDPVVSALESGLSVFCEKPFAATLGDCDEMIASAARANRILVVGHILRFDLRYLTVFEALRDGKLGKLIHLAARRTTWAEEGRIVDGRTTLPMYLGVHDLDVFRWLAGDIDRVYAEAGGAGLVGERIPDTVLATMRFKSGAVGALELSWATSVESGIEWDSRLEVIGSTGSAVVDIAQTGVAIYSAEGPRFPDTTYWPKTYGSPSGILRIEDEHFLRTIRRSRAWPQSLLDARAAVAGALALDRSTALGRTVSLSEVEAGA
jgi:UDP-N-acetylglucosamine 3-dehydrogenase